MSTPIHTKVWKKVGQTMEQTDATNNTVQPSRIVLKTTYPVYIDGGAQKRKASEEIGSSSSNKESKKSKLLPPPPPEWAVTLRDVTLCRGNDKIRVYESDDGSCKDDVKRFIETMEKEKLAWNVQFNKSAHEIFADKCKNKQARKICIARCKDAKPQSVWDVCRHLETTAIRSGKVVIVFMGPSMKDKALLGSNDNNWTKMYIKGSRLFMDAEGQRPAKFFRELKMFSDDQTEDDRLAKLDAINQRTREIAAAYADDNDNGNNAGSDDEEGI